MNDTDTLRVVCMACRRVLVEGRLDAPASHGVCATDAAHMLRDSNWSGDKPRRRRWAPSPDPRVVVTLIQGAPMVVHVEQAGGMTVFVRSPLCLN